MKRRSGFTVMARLVGLVKPLAGFMVLAVAMGLAGHLCASFITIFGGYAALELLGLDAPFRLKTIFACVILFAILRAVLRYAEQSCNHFIAFKHKNGINYVIGQHLKYGIILHLFWTFPKR